MKKEKSQNQNEVKNFKQGFTLLELLVVVVIIGILAAIALPQYRLAVDKAKYSTMIDLVKSVKNKQELLYMINGRYAIDFEELGADILPGNFELQEGKLYIAKSKDYSVILSKGYVYGQMFEPKISFLVYLDLVKRDNRYDSKMECWSYGNKLNRNRANKVCKSITRADNSSRDEDTYEVWRFK